MKVGHLRYIFFFAKKLYKPHLEELSRKQYEHEQENTEKNNRLLSSNLLYLLEMK